MDYGRLFFEPVACRGNMLFLGNNNPAFQGSREVISMEENLSRKRPFFSSLDELLYDEEYYYDEQLSEKKRRLTPKQVHLLEKSFEEENKLEPETKIELAKKLGLQPRQVAVWFQNRRARSKTKQLERDYDLLKASYDNLLSNYDLILKENEKLKYEVHSLTEKLQAKEENGQGPTSNPVIVLQANGPTISAQQQVNKTEDRQSSGTGRSGVENEDNPQIVDSGDSYFDCPTPHPYIATVQSEKDDISDDGRIYFPCMFAVATDHEHQQGQEEEGQELGWWVWS